MIGVHKLGNILKFNIFLLLSPRNRTVPLGIKDKWNKLVILSKILAFKKNEHL